MSTIIKDWYLLEWVSLFGSRKKKKKLHLSADELIEKMIGVSNKGVFG